jgi:hypothetical protein
VNFEDWKLLIRSQVSSDRSNAADELPEDGDDEEVVALLTKALFDEDELVRTCAAASLGDCNMESARQALREAVSKESDDLALGYVLGSLGMIGGIEDFEVLLSKLTAETSTRRIRIDSAEGIVHLALNNAVPLITREYTNSFTELDVVGLPALERIVERMNEVFSHIKNIVHTRLPGAKLPSEKEYLLKILEAIGK